MKFIFPIFLIFLITMGELQACPMCSGQDPRDKNYIYVIGGFILLIYVPMFYLYRIIAKLKNINNSNQK